MPISIIAHRGDCQFNIENTLSSIVYALKHGVTQIEIDVQLSNDNVMMVFHDQNLQRLAHVNKPIALQSFKQLSQLTLNSSVKDIPINKIPSLAQVVSLIKSYPEVTLFVEVKPVNFVYFSYRHVLTVLKETIKPVLSQVVIISFSYRFLRYTQKMQLLPVGFVLPDWSAYSEKMLKKLQPSYIFSDTDIIPPLFHLKSNRAKKSPKWVLYEISTIKQLSEFYHKGFTSFETFTPSRLLQATQSVNLEKITC